MIKSIVNKAYTFSKEKHSGQVRKFSGLPYFTHPKYVARIIEELTDDEVMVATALLHDVVEDTSATIEEIRFEFGDQVASYVGELTNPDEMLPDKKTYLATKMSYYMSNESLLIKLVDRYHNVLFLESDQVPDKFIVKYYKETTFILRMIGTTRQMTDEQQSVYDAISSIMQFIGLRHKLEELK